MFKSYYIFMLDVPKPSMDDLYSYLAMWEETERYSFWDDAFYKLFIKSFPKNVELSEIWIKCSVLNDFYNLHILDILPIAKHILNLNIDDRLSKKDYSLVNDLSKVKIWWKDKTLYSFATKYCAKHCWSDFPIYDKYIDKVLMYFKKKDHFCDFIKSDLKDYPKFVSILEKFKEKYWLICPFDDLDHYLWQLGKKYFW